MLRRMPTDLPFDVDDVAPERREVGELAGTRRRLGAAAGALDLGIALIEIDAGKRFSPPHAHADEDEVFLVLAAAGSAICSHRTRPRAPTPSASRRALASVQRRGAY